MPIFIVDHTYTLGLAGGRESLMAPHREWLRRRVETGILLAAGSYADGPGAHLVFRANCRDDLQADVSADPFVMGGVIAQTSVREWSPKFGTLLPL